MCPPCLTLKLFTIDNPFQMKTQCSFSEVMTLRKQTTPKGRLNPSSRQQTESENSIFQGSLSPCLVRALPFSLQFWVYHCCCYCIFYLYYFLFLSYRFFADILHLSLQCFYGIPKCMNESLHVSYAFSWALSFCLFCPLLMCQFYLNLFNIPWKPVYFL